jgi:hypothetical protein
MSRIASSFGIGSEPVLKQRPEMRPMCKAPTAARNFSRSP